MFDQNSQAIIVYKDGSYLFTDTYTAKSYENDPDWLTTIYPLNHVEDRTDMRHGVNVQYAGVRMLDGKRSSF